MPSVARLTFLVLAVFLLNVTQASQSDYISIEELSAVIDGDSIKVDCEVSYRLDDSVKEALNNGIEMKFSLEVELMHKSRYWLDNTYSSLMREFTVKYHALSKQYVMKVAGNEIEHSFPDLYSAFYYQRRLHNALLTGGESLQGNEHKYLRARARLVSEDLPLPLRIKSYLSSAWRPSSGWTIWPI